MNSTDCSDDKSSKYVKNVVLVSSLNQDPATILFHGFCNILSWDILFCCTTIICSTV